MDVAATSTSATLLGNKDCMDDCKKFYVFSYAVMVLYSLAGGIMAYLWTRINFSKILTYNRKALSDIEMSRTEQTTGLKTLNPHLNEKDIIGPVAEMPVQFIDSFRDKVKGEYRIRKVTDKTDLQKNRWGGVAEKDGFWLDADVEKQFIPGLFSLMLKVSCTSKEKTMVAFFLHDTFPKEIVFVNTDESGIAKLELTTYEAFTVGAYLFDSKTGTYIDLELDLNTVPGYPKNFYWS
jgi:hypothetical protein